MSKYVISTEFKKVLAVLENYYKRNRISFTSDILSSSRFILEKIEFTTPVIEEEFNFTIYVQHEVFIKYVDKISNAINLIGRDIARFSNFKINEINIVIDYELFEIVDSQITPIQTDWEEINTGQSKLLSLLSSSADSIDLQNIGNIARTILLLLSNIVYNDELHRPIEVDAPIQDGNFKLRLKAYISKELAGNSNERLRNFSKAAIDTVEKSIDLANNVTHKIGVEKAFAEVCVIGTIGTISIIKLIYKQNK